MSAQTHSDESEARDHDWIMERAEEMKALGETEPRAALDEVNRPMIRHWAEAMGDTDPRWQGEDAVAPPAMTQVWTMYGLDSHRPPSDPLHGTMQMLDEAGFTSVLGTNCDQTYARFLRPGERLSITTRLESVVGPKATGVGEGYFVTTVNTWWVDGSDGEREQVATMTFRVLKFKPGTGRPTVDKTRTVRPVVSRDNEFFFDGTRHGELRIQTCNACGAMRHPPGPVCPACHAMDRGYVVASGRGTVHSFLVHHAPQVPGKRLPLPLVLVDLEEGVRMVGAVSAPDGHDLAIGDPVHATFDRIDDDLTLVSWRVGADAETAVTEGVETGADLPAWSIEVTPTLIVSGAIATRDFQDVHHDRDLAVKRGSKDIFPNILTTTGLVQRFVGDWAVASDRGPVRVTACALRLGAPAYAGDTLTLTGSIVEESSDGGVVDVVGTCALGQHVSARITWEKP